MKLICKLFFLILLHVDICIATDTYYVDIIDGSDTNIGTDPDSAIRTFSRINELIQEDTIVSGDTIHLACGQTWHEDLQFGAPFNNIKHIVLTADSTCMDKPNISGADSISSWQKVPGKSYYESSNVAGPVMQVYVDDIPIRLARYPNEGFLTASKDSVGPDQNCIAPVDTYQPIAFIGDCLVTDSDLIKIDQINNENLVGAQISVKSVPYWWDKREVLEYTPDGTIYWDTRSRYEIQTNEQYYLENKLWMLDQPGEWYYDEVNQKLFIWLEDNASPTDRKIEVTTRKHAIHANTMNSIEVYNIGVEKTGRHGIYLEKISDVIINNLYVKDTGRDGFALNQIFNSAHIKNSHIENTGQDAVKVMRAPTAAAIAITQNTIKNSGTIGADLGSPKANLAAIFLNDQEALISDNTIHNTGYIGINARAGSNVKRNMIDDVCMALHDCGGIYFKGISRDGTDKTTVIEDNIIMGRSSYPTASSAVWGIYLDDFANGAIVQNNTVAYMPSGMLVHLASENKIKENVFYGNTKYQLHFSENLSEDYAGSIHDNIVEGNQFFPTDAELALNLNGLYNNINFGSFDSNFYSSFISNILIRTNYKPDFPADTAKWETSFHDFNSWQTKGLNSGTVPVPNGTLFNSLKLKDYIVHSVGQNHISNPDLENNMVDWSHWPADGLAHRQWLTPCNNSNGCIRFKSSSENNSNLVSSNIFPLTQNEVYRIRFSLFSKSDIKMLVRRNGPTYEPVGIQKTIHANSRWTDYEFVFSATANLNNAIFQFQMDADSTIEFDDVYLETVTKYEKNESYDDDSFLLTNTTLSPKYIDCPFEQELQKCSQMIAFPSAETVDWPIFLEPMTSQIVIWKGNPFVENRTVRLSKPNELRMIDK